MNANQFTRARDLNRTRDRVRAGRVGCRKLGRGDLSIMIKSTITSTKTKAAPRVEGRLRASVVGQVSDLLVKAGQRPALLGGSFLRA